MHELSHKVLSGRVGFGLGSSSGVVEPTRAQLLAHTRTCSGVLGQTWAYPGVLGRTRPYKGVQGCTRAYSRVLGPSGACSGVPGCTLGVPGRTPQ